MARYNRNNVCLATYCILVSVFAALPLPISLYFLIPVTEAAFDVGVAIGVVGAEAMVGKVTGGGLIKAGGEGIGSCVAA